MSNPNVKRVSLYFNLEDEEEKRMFEYIDKRKKSKYIKNLVLADIDRSVTVCVTGVTEDSRVVPEVTDDLSDVTLNDAGIDFD